MGRKPITNYVIANRFHEAWAHVILYLRDSYYSTTMIKKTQRVSLISWAAIPSFSSQAAV